MNHDVTKYVTNCHQCHVTKGHYTGSHTQQGLLVASNPLDLLCINFLRADPSRDSKENVLVLTDAFTKCGQDQGQDLSQQMVLCLWDSGPHS